MSIWSCSALFALFSWPTFTASVSAVPGATLMICRSLPAEPTEIELTRSTTEPAPSATELLAGALALRPMATELLPVAFASSVPSANPFTLK
ncbi:hypothetical protein CSR63_13710 [Salmonella enterica subsp. enterica serovar Weltevreden]|nr:hypothetical protein [Salmonella enterica subsp. enterica serovar Weltevreden]EDM5326374.1 hypothetical protein [Salmonella enterica subsp. enterica serovar Weltevreden]